MTSFVFLGLSEVLCCTDSCALLPAIERHASVPACACAGEVQTKACDSSLHATPMIFCLGIGTVELSFLYIAILYPFPGRGRHSHQSRGDFPSHGREGAAKDEVVAFAF